ncbi:MAG: minichromosome maintenance protein MCM [Nanoarchaeota archaeon]|mgnify:CR=1 FL=1
MHVDATEQIERFKEFFSYNYEDALHHLVSRGINVLKIDFAELAKFDPELADQLLEEPEETIRAAELAIDSFDFQLKNFRVRLYNLPRDQFVFVRDIRSSHLNKFMIIEGIVRQSSDVRPQVTSAKFECPSCGNTITMLQLDSRFKEPTRCSCGRRGRFRLVSKDLVDAQRLVLEEIPESLEGGEQPKRLSVFLREDLVEPKMEKKTTPGSKVIVYGIVKEVPIFLRTGAQSIRYDLMIEANNIEPIEKSFGELDLDETDEKEIKKLSQDPKIFEKLVKSMAPSIYGHEKIKEAFVLQLMGGVKKLKEDGTTTRGDIHILLVGDPGSGKSQMLTFISKIAPKGRLVSGKGSTGAGLTATVVKDEFLRGWALEAGALVLANGGIAVIDELDKMNPEDRDALHEALEQQRISISKANIQATLRAETTVLAAANPKLGRFDPYTPIAAQIDLPPTLINRFDLIFPIRDLPNRDLDEKIAGHVLNLQQNPEDIRTEIPPQLVKKYLSYARQKVIPHLTNVAIEEIKEFYVGLRNSAQVGESEIRPIPISARQLEALVRLAEASARVRLSDKVTREDAKRAIELLKHCLMQVGFDYETGQIDIDRIATGLPASQRSRIVTIREIIKRLENKLGKMIPITDVITEAAEQNINEAQVEEVIEQLKREAEIFEPRRGFVSRL